VRHWIAILKVSAGSCAALILSQYVAGYIFLWWIGANRQLASPLTIVRYAYYYADRPEIARPLKLSSSIGIGIILLCALPLLLPRRRPLHGQSQFAGVSEISRAGLFAPSGITMGYVKVWLFWSRNIVLGGQAGLYLSARPRAGKGVSIVIPNLLTWHGSVVCSDIKKENWTITAGYRRASGQVVYLFDPLSKEGRTARWNPLGYVSADPGQRVNDLQLIASMFFADPPGADPFWAAGGRSLFLGIALYLFETPSLPCTIGEILRQGMANDEEGFAARWKRVIHGRMRGSNPLSETCVRALSDIIDLAPPTASSIRKTFTSRLELWANPVLDAATAANDFDLRLLRKQPMSIYLGVNPKDLDRLAPLLSLFFQQAIAMQTDELPEHNPELRHQVLMVLDEFPALGPIPIMTKASGFLPGYNVRTLLITQTPAQLRQVYGLDGAKTLLKTLAARIYFAPENMEDAEEISKELGTTTVQVKSLSKPAFELFRGKGGRYRSVSISAQKRPLLLPQEVKQIGPDSAIAFVENAPPILCRKIRYYAMPFYRRRLVPPPDVPPVTAVVPKRVREHDDPMSDTGVAVDFHTRDATVEDIEQLQSLTLDDFAADLSRVPLPAAGPLTDQDLSTAAERFLETLRQG
jgi:type IV secretion system protein VirD4